MIKHEKRTITIVLRSVAAVKIVLYKRNRWKKTMMKKKRRKAKGETVEEIEGREEEEEGA